MYLRESLTTFIVLKHSLKPEGTTLNPDSCFTGLWAVRSRWRRGLRNAFVDNDQRFLSLSLAVSWMRWISQGWIWTTLWGSSKLRLKFRVKPSGWSGWWRPSGIKLRRGGFDQISKSRLCSLWCSPFSRSAVSDTAFVTRCWSGSSRIQTPSLSWPLPSSSSTQTCTAPTWSRRGRWSSRTSSRTCVVRIAAPP